MRKEHQRLGLTSIRNRILFFALLITLLPSLTVGWLISNMMHATLEENLEEKLVEASRIVRGELDLWFRERNYDLHVFSNSFVISENYSKYLEARLKSGSNNSELSTHLRTLKTYLKSVKNKFTEYDNLYLLDKEGDVVAAAAESGGALSPLLPEDMAQQLQQSQFFKGQVFFDVQDNIPFVVMGTPLFTGQSEEFEGVLAVRVSLAEIHDILKSASESFSNAAVLQAMLVRLDNGRYFITAQQADIFNTPIFADEKIMIEGDNGGSLTYFPNHLGERVIGRLFPLVFTDWGLILAEDYDTVFARVEETRNRNYIFIAVLSIIIGLAAFFLTKQIIRPLRNLTEGAQEVADGNLDIRLPVEKNDELGFATSVFNEMVAELSRSQAKLEKMATQDVLTKLPNRKQILRIVHNRFEYYQRYSIAFGVLMIDVDNFKHVNDTYGHIAGDEVLRDIGKIFKETLRSFDSAGRYGGEEFLVVLVDSGDDNAKQVAERIRQAVENHSINYEDQTIKVTVSIGIAMVSPDDTNENSLINRADKALYAAKENGRNQTAYLNTIN
ncbi:MAG: diguanylate cyclase [Desulfocapsaceae bacterium]|nr:diguanylate cyclase [Desulfocapsaceae bacterium]